MASGLFLPLAFFLFFMKKLLIFEFRKMLRVEIYALLGLFFIYYTAIAIYLVYQITIENLAVNLAEIQKLFYSIISTFNGFLAIIGIIHIGFEKNENTLKKSLSSGLDKSAFYLLKYISLLPLGILLHLFAYILLGFWVLFYPDHYTIFELLPYAFLHLLWYGVIALIFGSLGKNMTISFVLYFFCRILEGTLWFVDINFLHYDWHRYLPLNHLYENILIERQIDSNQLFFIIFYYLLAGLILWIRIKKR